MKRSNNVREGGRENRGHSGGGEGEDGKVKRVHCVVETKCMGLRKIEEDLAES
jgi:hypothetical protein